MPFSKSTLQTTVDILVGVGLPKPSPKGRGSKAQSVTPKHNRSGQEIARPSGDESFDVIDDMIVEGLYGFLASPGHVGSNDEIRQVQIKQRTALTRRFFTKRIITSAGNR